MSEDTLTKSKLIQYLIERDDIEIDAPIYAEWEGQTKPILKSNFTISHKDSKQSVLIDVENCF